MEQFDISFYAHRDLFENSLTRIEYLKSENMTVNVKLWRKPKRAYGFSVLPQWRIRKWETHEGSQAELDVAIRLHSYKNGWAEFLGNLPDWIRAGFGIVCSIEVNDVWIDEDNIEVTYETDVVYEENACR